MAKIIPSRFCAVEFPTDLEAKQSSILTGPQKMWLQYNLSNIANEKLAMEFTPNDLNTFMQREAELKGQIGILQYLLDCSQTAEDEQRAELLSNQSPN
jgi:hypothetical protein